MLAYRWQDITFETVQITGEEYQTLLATHQPSGQTVSVPLIPRGETIPLISDPNNLGRWSLESNAKHEAFDRLGSMVETCTELLGAKPANRCQREPNHTGVHAHCFLKYNDPLLYRESDPAQFATGHCKICFEKLTDKNTGSGLASGLYCREHLEEGRAPTRAYNRCKACGHEGESPLHELRNYSAAWHDGDIHCGKCGTYVRMYDAG